MSFVGRLARIALFAAVAAAVGAGTLPALLKQATPTEEAARVALPAPRAREIAKPAQIAAPLAVAAPVAAAPLAVQLSAVQASADRAPPASPVPAEPAIVPPPAAVVTVVPAKDDPLLAMAKVEPPPATAEIEPPLAATAAPMAAPAPAATVPGASAALESFPPVQPLTMDAASNMPPPGEQAAPAPIMAMATVPPRVGKSAWRKRVVSHSRIKRRYVRPRPFSIRALLAALHIR